MSPFERILRKSAGVYGLFLLPTLLLCLHFPSDPGIARHIEGTWQAGFWHLPGLGETASRVILDGLTWIAIGLATWLFWKGFQQVQASQANHTGRILRWTALCGLILLAAVPFHSSDLYGYINRGVQQSLYQTNPYLTTIAQLPNWRVEPLFHEHWIHNPCPYGFFFAQLTAWLSTLGGHRFVAIFLLFKLFNLALLVGTTVLIATLARQLGQQKPWVSAYLFGLNPLVLLHVMGNGHNDILMAFLLLASLWTLTQPRWLWAALPLLTLSVLAKYASILALPFVLLYLIRQRQWASLGLGAAISLILTGLLAWPYIPTDGRWPWAAMLENAGKPQHSITAMLGRLVAYGATLFQFPARAAMAFTQQGLKWLLFGGFALLNAWLWWQAFQQPKTRSARLLDMVIWPTAFALTVLVTLVSAKFHPWYAVMFLPGVLLLPEGSWLRRFGVLFSLFQIAGFTLLQNVHILGVLLLTILPLWLSLKSRAFRRV